MTDHDTTPGAPELGYVPGNDFTECVREGCPAFHHQYGDRLYFQSRNAPLGVHITPPCASCGEPSIHRILLRGEPIPVCLRHLNHWRTPDAPETEALAAARAIHAKVEEGHAAAVALAKIMDPEAFQRDEVTEHRRINHVKNLQWAARRAMVTEWAARLLATDWLATRDAAQRAAGAETALREAADAYSYATPLTFAQWLRERADRIGADRG